ncbi:MAG TPA: hypothetical protein DCE42_28825 [Myxococcales bacterium]|nr:hypothetical protein [Deltaproteobacteria bacterium]MBU49468.1 hypothetical protein [Deltaproteobacteria bacterium]HAA58801.1 hypothetical protein [Myxococcales bacterium]|tara:strand:- start:6195 stop:7343 length:1149 start_codon:yes stop_codon:yes gene_type:complete
MQEILLELNPLAQNYVQSTTPPRMKKMAASGKLPLPPQQMVFLLYILAQEEDQSIAQQAAQSFRELPDGAFNTLLKDPQCKAPILDFIAQNCYDSAQKIHDVLLHTNTTDNTVAWLAQFIEGENLGLIVQNQQRQQRNPAIVVCLLRNPALSQDQRSRVIEFAIRENIPTGLSKEELRPYVAEGLLEELTQTSAEEVLAEAQKEPEEEEIPEELIEETAEELAAANNPLAKYSRVEEEETPEEEEKRLTIEQQVATWSVSQKIKGAMKGNKQLRTMLVRDSNRLVCTAVLKNPRVTESEIISLSKSRSVSDDVIRDITRNREWMKVYTVKVNLAANPKCPRAVALRLLNHLRANDLRSLVSNKNVPGEISRAAKKLASSRKR